MKARYLSWKSLIDWSLRFLCIPHRVAVSTVAKDRYTLQSILNLTIIHGRLSKSADVLSRKHSEGS